MKNYVLDASVVISAIDPMVRRDNTTNRLEKLFRQVKTGQAKCFAVPLLPIEVANGLRFSLRDREKGIQAFSKFTKLPVELIGLSSEQITDILEAAYKLGTTVYDTAYHFLARQINATFLTCDKHYYEKAKPLGNIELWS